MQEMKNDKERILILDGAMGTMIQKYGLTEEDYHCGPFSECAKELKGNNECLNLTRPEIIRAIHEEYIAAGADIIESNTFSANTISQSEYGCGDFASAMAFEGARLARLSADKANAARPADRKVMVAGSMGPTSKSLSLSPDVADSAFRIYSFDQMKEAYRAQAEALLKGGADMLLIETCFDALNVKAALAAIHEIGMVTHPTGTIPVIVSVSVGDRSGRTLTGQTLEAFYTSVRHYPLVAFGLNCSLGASELTPLLEDVGRWCGCGTICYPNAGLPNEMGGYDQTPEQMAGAVREMAAKGLVNITGGCCGTTPAHIRAIADAVKDIRPRSLSTETGTFAERSLKVSGLEAVTVDVRQSNFINIGERTNVAGSRKFARLISECRYDEALQIAARQIEDGASIIDINMDDAMLDSAREMERFVRYISNDPAVAKAALMIDSSHWETILAGLKNAQGKCIVNSISLKEGTEAFLEKARTIRSLGAAMVVMAFDEKGQATTYDRKIEICSRAYRLLTEEAGIPPKDIIFDVNILSIGTGIEEHARYAVDFIEAVRWIKANLPGALTSGGVSNLSFSFRGNNAVREAMHSAFLYHAIKAGLDMAIVNPSMLQVYDGIEPELLGCVEDVIFDRDPQATERLIEKATRMLEEKTSDDASPSSSGASGSSQSTPMSSHNAPMSSHGAPMSSHGAPMSSQGTSMSFRAESRNLQTTIPIEEKLKSALIKGRSDTLEADLMEALAIYGKPVNIIEGPLMEGMETVGRLFGDGKMFLPQVVKSAKVMRDAVDILNPYMGHEHIHSDSNADSIIVLATVKGDVHDIGKNIVGIVLTCNGFNVKDLGVMVDKETILDEAERTGADIISVSGLITPSLYQMEELCREMSARGLTTPLIIGGATTSALHTAVRLAPLYDHVFYGADASAAAVIAKKIMMDREGFESEEHMEQKRIRDIYMRSNDGSDTEGKDKVRKAFPAETYMTDSPEDVPVQEIPAEEVLGYFDWKMFYAIWGVKYGSAVPEAAELMQLRRDAEEELAFGDYRIMLGARFLMGSSDGEAIIAENNYVSIPMLRQENGKMMSLSDFVVPASGGRTSPFGVFAITVNKKSKAHVEGCSCPACNSRYEDMIGRTVRQTLAEAASKWLSVRIEKEIRSQERGLKVVKPAAGYSSCPDHTLKKDILELLGEDVHICNEACCHSHGRNGLGISLTESYAMMPEASICGFIFMHPEASYPEIRNVSRKQYEEYAGQRKMSEETARRFLGHLLR